MLASLYSFPSCTQTSSAIIHNHDARQIEWIPRRAGNDVYHGFHWQVRPSIILEWQPNDINTAVKATWGLAPMRIQLASLPPFHCLPPPPTTARRGGREGRNQAKHRRHQSSKHRSSTASFAACLHFSDFHPGLRATSLITCPSQCHVIRWCYETLISFQTLCLPRNHLPWPGGGTRSRVWRRSVSCCQICVRDVPEFDLLVPRTLSNSQSSCNSRYNTLCVTDNSPLFPALQSLMVNTLPLSREALWPVPTSPSPSPSRFAKHVLTSVFQV